MGGGRVEERSGWVGIGIWRWNGWDRTLCLSPSASPGLCAAFFPVMPPTLYAAAAPPPRSLQYLLSFLSTPHHKKEVESWCFTFGAYEVLPDGSSHWIPTKTLWDRHLFSVGGDGSPESPSELPWSLRKWRAVMKGSIQILWDCSLVYQTNIYGAPFVFQALCWVWQKMRCVSHDPCPLGNGSDIKPHKCNAV